LHSELPQEAKGGRPMSVSESVARTHTIGAGGIGAYAGQTNRAATGGAVGQALGGIAVGAPQGATAAYGASHGYNYFKKQSLQPAKEVDLGAYGQPLGIGGTLAGLGTGEVPNFAKLHAHERQRLERAKYLNRYITQPEPFVFAAPERSRNRQPPLAKDPSQHPRYQRQQRARPQSAGVTPKHRAAAADHRAIVSIQRAAAAEVPRSTEKTLRAQQHVQRVLQERREQEKKEQEQHQQREVQKATSEMRGRLISALGTREPYEEKINRIVADKRHTTGRVHSEKKRHLQEIKQRVARRPLLMEQKTDHLARARRRALFRVRNTLESYGVVDIENHFNDNELDDMDFEPF
jgi:hypothetical protein